MLRNMDTYKKKRQQQMSKAEKKQLKTYLKNIEALRQMQKSAMEKFIETTNEDFRQKAIEYGIAKSKLRALILKLEAGVVRMEVKGIKNTNLRKREKRSSQNDKTCELSIRDNEFITK